MTTQATDIAVVGGGLAGLAAATYAARQGKRVTLFERSSSAGGRAMTTEHSGFSFNMGAHALYRGGPAETALRELGVAFTGAPPNVSRYLVARGGKFHRFVSDMRTLATTRLFTTFERVEAGRVIMRMAHLDLAPLADVTAAEWLDAEVHSDTVRRYIESAIRLSTFTHDPERMSAGAALAAFQGATVTFVDGGWQTLVGGLQAAAERAGVAFETSRRADALEFEDGRVAGVRLANGGHVASEAAVLAVEPQEAARLMGGSVATQSWTNSEPVRAAVLDLGLKRLPVPRRIAVISQDAPVYLAVHSVVAKLAPEGEALVSLIRYLEPGEHNPAGVLAEMEAFADFVQPGWRDLEVYRQYLPSMVVMNREVLASQGGKAGRPRFDDGTEQNVFVAGDWVGPDGLLADTVFASARDAGLAAAGAVKTTPLAIAS